MPYKPTRRLTGHTRDVVRACFLEENIVTASADESLRVWDLNSQQNCAKYSSHVGPVSDAVSVDSCVFYAGEKGVCFLDPRANSSVVISLKERAMSIAIDRTVDAPNGHTLVYSTERGELVFFDLFMSKEVARVRAHDSVITSLGFSPDGSVLVSTGLDGNVRLSSGANFDIIHTYGSFNRTSCLFGSILGDLQMEKLRRQVSLDTEATKPSELGAIDGRMSLGVGALFADGIFRIYSTASRLDPVLKMKHLKCGNSTKNFAIVSDYVAFPSTQGSVTFWRGDREVYTSPVVHADDCCWVASNPSTSVLLSCGVGVDSSAVIWTTSETWEEPEISFEPIFPQMIGL